MVLPSSARSARPRPPPPPLSRSTNTELKLPLLVAAADSLMTTPTASQQPQFYDVPLSGFKWLHQLQRQRAPEAAAVEEEKEKTIAVDAAENEAEKKEIVDGTEDKESIAEAAAKKGKAIAAEADGVGGGGSGDECDNQSGDDDVAVAEEDINAKTWNLRPRKPAAPKQGMSTGGGGGSHGGQESKGGGSGQLRQEWTNRVRSCVDAKMAVETKERLRFSVSLTKEEIEEDFILMTGAKPPRRPKRRNKQVQKHIDNLYPGSWMECPLPPLYKETESLEKVIKGEEE